MLGRVKFIFPNRYFVFLHDTPSRKLFSKAERAFSSGCIRIEKPLDLARRDLAAAHDQSLAALKLEQDGQEHI